MVMGELPESSQVLVVGGGPGGYAAAFRAADLGFQVTLASDEDKLGGACLLRGCIPSKSLLDLSTLIHRAGEAGGAGLRFGEPDIELERLRKYKDELVDRLSQGLRQLCEARGVKLVHGQGRFVEGGSLRLQGDGGAKINFEHAIIATGSRPADLPGFAVTDEGVMDSTGALNLRDIPERLLVVGGGYVGLELGQVYATLGSQVSLAETDDALLPGVDPELTRPLAKRLREDFKDVLLGTEATGMEAKSDGMAVTLKAGSEELELSVDRVLLGVGRVPNTDELGLEHTDVEIDDEGFVTVDDQCRSTDSRIYAIGDAAGGQLLAHVAKHEGRVAAEAIAGRAAAFEARAVPAVVYTDPEVAWCGLDERQARNAEREVVVARFPWRASGRALSLAAEAGMTKLVLERDSGRVLGVGAVGRGAEALIAEGVLAIEMGAIAKDLALSIHAHPTLAETIGESAELFEGAATHLPPERKSED